MGIDIWWHNIVIYLSITTSKNCLDHGTTTKGRYVVVEYLRINLVMTTPRFTLVYPAITIFFTILPYFLGINIFFRY